MGFIGSSSGKGDIAIFTKYRFWRKDSLGLQESAAVLLKVITDTADSNKNPEKLMPHHLKVPLIGIFQ